MYSGGTELEITPYSSNPVLRLGAKFLTVINPFTRLDQRILASVAEHLPSPWGSFYNTLLLLIFFFPLGMYFAFKRGRDEDWFILLFGITSVYFAGSMIRLTLILAPGVAILSAVAAYNLDYYYLLISFLEFSMYPSKLAILSLHRPHYHQLVRPLIGRLQ
ncbi:MAG: STT3 domain-containing protein [Candidatus Thorarchaeota archaeon]